MENTRKSMDYKQFARDAVSGKYTQKELAEMYDFSLSAIKKIAAGQRRPAVREMIEAAQEEARLYVGSKGLEFAEMAMETLVRAMQSASIATAAAAAKDLLNRVAGRPALAERAAAAGPAPAGRGVARYRRPENEPDDLTRIFSQMSETTLMHYARDTATAGADPIGDEEIAAAEARDIRRRAIEGVLRRSEGRIFSAANAVEVAQHEIAILESKLAESRVRLVEAQAAGTNGGWLPETPSPEVIEARVKAYGDPKRRGDAICLDPSTLNCSGWPLYERKLPVPAHKIAQAEEEKEGGETAENENKETGKQPITITNHDHEGEGKQTTRRTRTTTRTSGEREAAENEETGKQPITITNHDHDHERTGKQPTTRTTTSGERETGDARLGGMGKEAMAALEGEEQSARRARAVCGGASGAPAADSVRKASAAAVAAAGRKSTQTVHIIMQRRAAARRAASRRKG